ncbi:hypothetical protein SAMN05421747_101250 [Parapedobacter composti]|uniref:SusD family protein n=2 Tax=Parapedobacter composti TaxID=623281 RepID=A0A1I1E129_9SPHI|nr:hypothetical protein SAMN05421747_101250 [Parapedobacter composti]
MNMKKTTIKTKPALLPLIAVLISMVSQSCTKFFELLPEDAVDESQMYRHVYDADAAVIGIYGKLPELARQYLVWNELRGDLMDVTMNSDHHLVQINNHQVQPDNPYANPRDFYEVILNCNDALANFAAMRKDGRLMESEFVTRYSDIGMLRTWLYLQLGIHFGTVPYVTQPVDRPTHVTDPSLFPKLPFERLLDSLITFAESLPFQEEYPAGTTLLTTVDGYNTRKIFVMKSLVLADLHLWKGNYRTAATHYRKVMEKGGEYTNLDDFYGTYRLTYVAFLTGENWINIFSAPFGERVSNYENIWMMPYDRNFEPENPFIPLFANQGAGRYLLRPSEFIMQYWDEQMRGLTPFDLRGRTRSYVMNGGQPVVNKHIATYHAADPFQTTGKWILYRAGAVHLRFAEAANRDGYQKLAYALLNGGIMFTYDPTPGINGRDVTDIMNTLHYPAPYDFDARMGDFPRFRSDWHRNTGIRGRAGLSHSLIAPADSARFFDMTNPDPYLREVVEGHGLTLYMEEKLLAEGALELAFEGYRWPDLLRIALRREKEAPGTGGQLLKQWMDAKFERSGQTLAVDLSNPQHWYLPFNWH